MKTILVPIDFSDITPRILASAESLAKPLKARLVLVHVISPSVIMTAYGFAPEDAALQFNEEKDRARRLIERHAAKLRDNGTEVLTELMEGSGIASILRATEEQDADMIVLGSHGHGALYEILVGSTAKGVLQEARCPVLVIPPPGRSRPKPGEK